MDGKRLAQAIFTSVLLTAIAFLIFRGAAFFFLPLFILIPFGRLRRGRRPFARGDEDPADWWKKGKQKNGP